LCGGKRRRRKANESIPNLRIAFPSLIIGTTYRTDWETGRKYTEAKNFELLKRVKAGGSQVKLAV